MRYEDTPQDEFHGNSITKLNLLHMGPSMYQLLLLDTFSSWAELLISQYCI